MSTTITGTAGTTIAKTCTGPQSGKPVLAGDVNAPLLSIENDIATIGFGNCTIAGNKTFSGNVVVTGSLTCNGTVACNDNVTIAQAKALVAAGTGVEMRGTWKSDSTGSDTTLTGLKWKFDASSKVSTLGRSVPSPARVVLSDADHTVSIANGKRFTLATAPAAVPRVITLKSTGTGTVPDEGETLEFFCDAPNAAPGTAYQFVTEAAAHVAAFTIATVAPTGVYWAEFEFVSGVWKLARNSGVAYDGADEYGVQLT